MNSPRFKSIFHILMFFSLLTMFLGTAPARAARTGGLPLRPLLTLNAWSALGSGLNNVVYAIAVSSTGDVYAGGLFTNVGGDSNASYIVKWNGSSWSPLGSGLNADVRTIAINSTGDLYVGGSFTDVAGNTSIDYAAKWDGSAWSALGNGLNNSVNDIAISGSNVYVGGNFTNAGDDVNADFIAKLDGGTWAALGSTSLNGTVTALAISGAQVYAGGNFTNVGNHIAGWDGTSWSALGSGLNAQVDTIVLSSGNVYAGGFFNDAGGDANADKIARWNGSSWSALGSGLSSFVQNMVISGSNLYASGNFLNAGGDANADFIARWDGASWSALGTTPLSSNVDSMVISGLNLYAAGNFTNAGGDPSADYVALFQLDGTAPTVNSFTATSPSNSLNIPISAFSASDNVGVTGYKITEDNTIPLATDAGWTASAPTTYTVGSDGSYTLYPWAKDAMGNVSAVYGSPASVTVDTSIPTVSAFSAPSSSTSLAIDITTFTASDDVGVTGYKITENNTPPLAGDAGWTASAPTIHTVASSGSYTLYPWAKDAAGNVSAVYGSPASVTVDASAPTVSAFSVPSSSSSLDIGITTFTASDDVGVTGYKITENNTPPLAGDSGWTASAPTTYTVASSGSYSLYPWAKDAMGNVSAVYGSPASVTVDTALPTVTAFTAPSSSTSLDIQITTFTASDDVGVTGYKITENNTPPLAGDTGWTASAPTTYTVASSGSYTLYPWAKDGDGNISAVYGSPASVSVDTAAPTVNSFTATSPSSSLNIPITAFTASDTVGVTGYLITESSTPPSAGAVGWTASAPTAYAVGSLGNYILYPWAKDAVGNISAVYGSPATVTVCGSAITVTSSADSGAGTLRQAIVDACVGDINNISMIDFAPALSGSTIHLTSMLTIAKNMTIDGSGLDPQITISGDTDPAGPTPPDGVGDVRVFSITGGSPGLTVTLDSLIVTKGATSGHGAGLFMEQGMHVTIRNSTFSDNHAGGRGGGIGNQGGLTLINSTVSGNSAASTDGGGGISNESGLTLINSTISNNSATGTTASGGGLLNTGGATITNSTLFGNSSNVYGGGISTTANLTITNSTIAGNSASITGGLQVDGNVTHLRNTIIANNTSTTINSLIHNDCTDTSDYPAQPTPDGDGIMTNINNLIGDGSCSAGSTGLQTGDPRLGPLADHGGPTQTLGLFGNSPALNAGNDAACAGAPNNLDQRGVTRPQGAHCDIGAFELVPAAVDVRIGGTLQGFYSLFQYQAARVNYAGLDSGPVRVTSTNATSIISAMRDAWMVNGVTTSFAQLMGLPLGQVSDKYVFPGYNNVTLNDQLRIGNVDTVPSTVTVTIGGVLRGTYTLQPNEAVRINYAGLDSGPVIVDGTDNVDIISAIREAWAVNGTTTSFVQLMGLPATQLSDKYVFPGYNNVTLNEQLRIGNVDTVPSTVTVTIGGVLRGTYTLQPDEAVRVNYAGLDSGPVVVDGTDGVNIISAIRDAWMANGVTTSFAQLMGMPATQLSDQYVFPAYNNVTLNDQLRIGNVDTVPSTVTVTIGGVLRGTYILQPDQAVRVNYAGLDSGPVVVQGTAGVHIISAIREAWAVNGVTQSFVQLMGLPFGQLSSTYLFPGYNNVTLNEQLRIAVP